jgi:DNA-nicking Smr family endonuclease
MGPARDEWMPEEPVVIPITGELDLHTFRPGEVGELIRDYLAECGKLGLKRVRVIHGKGTGALRTGVHRLLETLPEVEGMEWPASAETGGWGATWVRLNPKSEIGGTR